MKTKEEIQKTFLYRLGGKHGLTYMKILGSILVLISGFLPFLDNLLVWIFPGFDKLLDIRGVPLRTDIWLNSLYVSLVLSSIGGMMKAFWPTFFIPIYAGCYSALMYELMRQGIEIDPDWSHRLGFLLMLVPLFYILYRLQRYIKAMMLRDVVLMDTLNELNTDD